MVEGVGMLYYQTLTPPPPNIGLDKAWLGLMWRTGCHNLKG